MQPLPATGEKHDRVVSCLAFVESLARRMASTMPHSIEVSDLVQDGVLGLIDASHRFDEGRGIKFETFAERRVRGAERRVTLPAERPRRADGGGAPTASKG